MKRARTSGGSVTGGTGDVKPQIVTLTTPNVGSTNTYAVAQQPLPVPRFGTMKTKATIMEILKVWWYLGLRDANDVSNTKWAFLSTAAVRSQGELASLLSSEGDAENSTVFAMVVQDQTLIVSGAHQTLDPITIDLTDNNGNGVLIAVDKIFLTYGEVGGSIVSRSTAKLLYRLVNVGVTEYVGIVQSQQG